MEKYDRIIIGAGIYGLYAALFCSKLGLKVLVLEKEDHEFSRATYINQARVHNGYHYPRSISTAGKSAYYFNKFNQDFEFCINKTFNKIYGISSTYSWTNGNEFKSFCDAAKIPCELVDHNKYFKEGACEAAYLTKEYCYDAKILGKYFLSELEKNDVSILFSSEVVDIKKDTEFYYVTTNNGSEFKSSFVLNASYASTNQVISKLFNDFFPIKYELCEIILCEVNDKLKHSGITVMDGPFFSIMPFGNTKYHSLTSVTFTPHSTCYETLPSFSCQNGNESFCNIKQLGNCNDCPNKPKSAFPYMSALAKKYLKDDYIFDYKKSLFSMKPIMKSSEIDDSRPTIIVKNSSSPTFVSVLSGKINTVYDLDEVLLNG